jgi:hypothetical protein
MGRHPHICNSNVTPPLNVAACKTYLCAALAEGVFGAEIDRNTSQSGEQTVDGENDEARGQSVDSETPEDHR